MKKNLLVAAIVVVLAGGAIWFINNSRTESTPLEPGEQVTNTEANTATPVSESKAPEDTQTMVKESVKEIVVEASEFKFMPATLTLKKGEKVRLVLKNIGKMPHNFVIDELGVQTKTISPDDEGTIEFTPSEVGTFEYYCSIGQHRANGMKGMLTVTE